MHDQTDAVINRIAAEIAHSSTVWVDEIVSSAREQAMVEATSILKDMFVTAILEQVLSQISEPQPCQPAPAQPPPGEEDDQIRREIEAIRSQLTANEQQLAELKTGPPRPAPNGTEDSAAPATMPESGCGTYVYGIVAAANGQADLRLPRAGIDPAHPVYPLPHRDIQAVVSQVPLPEYGQESHEARLNDLAWLKTRVQAHQDIVQAVLSERAIIPMRFCTIYQSEERVEQVLAEHYDEFAGLLGGLKDKQEWGVKVYCDHQALADHVGERSPRVKQLQAEVARKSQGAAYFMKKKVDETIAEEVERFGDEYAQRLHDLLADCAEQSVVNPLQGKALTGRTEDMLLNGAYLVRKDQLPTFRAVTERMISEGDSTGLAAEVTGPWPPYNFVRTVQSEDVQ